MKERFVLWVKSDYTYFHLMLAFGVLLGWLMTSLLQPINWIVVAVLLLTAAWQLWRSTLKRVRIELWFGLVAILTYFSVALYLSPLVLDYYAQAGSSDVVRYVALGQKAFQIFLANPSQTYLQFMQNVNLSTAAFYWVIALFALIGGGSPAGISIVCAWFGALGGFYFVRAFHSLLTDRSWLWFALLTFFFPSIVFWAGLPLKDLISFWSLGLMVYGLSTFVRGQPWIGLTRIVFAACTCFAVRPYFAVFFSVPLIGIGLWLVARSLVRRSTSFLIASLALALIGSFLLKVNIDNNFFLGIDSLTSLDTYQQTAGGTTGGSSIRSTDSLPSTDSSPLVGSDTSTSTSRGILYLVERAWYVFTVMFRPLPWEAHNRFALLASLENILLLCMSGLILWKVGDLARLLIKEPLLIFALVFMALFVGAFSLQVVNLGTMARLKINVLPFFFIFFAIAFELCSAALNNACHRIFNFSRPSLWRK